MDRDATERPADGPGEARPQGSLAPLLAALAVVAIAVVVGLVFLGGDDEGELVRPDRMDATGPSDVRAVVAALPVCQRISRAQADFEDDRILVELVAVDADGCEQEGTREVVAEVTLPQPVGDRDVVAGVGRTRLPCVDDGVDVRCAPEG